MEQFSKRFKKVKLLSGNHEERYSKRIQEFLPSILPLVINPLELLSYGLTNVEVIKTTVPNTKPMVRGDRDIELPFFGMEGDVVIGHFSFCGKTAHEKAIGWIGQWKHYFRLKKDPVVLIQNHTHRLLVEYESSGRVLVHGGCLCKPMAYMFDPQGIGVPPALGYITCNQDKIGNTDISSIRAVPCM